MGTIREEIHQARPFASVAEEGVVTLVATADRVRSGLSEVVEGRGITRLLDRLEARRLVRRVRCPHDRRQVLCRATAEAGRLLAGLDAPMAAAAERAFAPLDAPNSLKMIELLDAIRAERIRT